MNMTGFIELHQGERHHEADGGPLETPDGQFRHLTQTLPRELRRSTTSCLRLLPGKTGLPRAQHAAIACRGVGLLASKAPNRLLPGNFELPLLFGDS
jgi:hypothetical protein